MKRLVVCLTLSSLSGHLHGMQYPDNKSSRDKCLILMKCLERKKFISEVTYTTVMSRSPRYLETILSEIDQESLAKFNTLDLKERCGSKLNQSETEALTAAALNILKTPSLATFEEIHKSTKLLCEQQYKEKSLRNKQQTQNIIQAFFKSELITKCTYEAFSQTKYFDEYLTCIEQKESHLKALASCCTCLDLVAQGSELNNQQHQELRSSHALLLFLKPLKTLESVSRTIEWLGNNQKISIPTARFLSTTEQFLDFYTMLKHDDIELFLKHYECTSIPDKDPRSYEQTTFSIAKMIRDYMATQRAKKPFVVITPQVQKSLTDKELDAELAGIHNIHLRTYSSEKNSSPRTESPSPETVEEIKEPEIVPVRKQSDPQSPAIDIKNIKRFFTPEPTIFEEKPL